MKTVKSIRLTMTEGSSDKEYRIHLLESDQGFVVNYENGRRNSTLKGDTKTKVPVPQAEAEDIFNKLLKEKTRKGYLVDGEVTSEFIVKAKSKDAILVQLLKEISESEVEKYLKDPNFGMQEKKDGERRTIRKLGDEVSGGNKKGESTNLSSLIEKSLPKSDLEIDGEAIGDILFAFDLLKVKDSDLRSLPYKERYAQLKKIKFGKNIEILPVHLTESEKRVFLKELQERKAEGAVFKDMNGIYKVGREGSSAHKYKFYKTATVKVSALTKGKRSVQMSVLSGKDFVDVGAVTIPANQQMPEVGDFLEVRYLYAYKGGSLFQPTCLFKRNDADDSDVGISQLSYKEE